MNLAKTALILTVLLFVVATLLGQPSRADPLAAEPAPPDTPEPNENKSRPIKLDDDEKFEQRVADFMHRKLDASGQVLEGLVTEDFEKIKKGAKTMARMSQASDWKMFEGPMYSQFSNRFRKVCDDLVEAGDKENVDGAGLAYMRLTMGCITCHTYVRKQILADATIPPPGRSDDD